MVDNRRVPTEKGVELADAVSVFLDGGKGFNGWKSVKITKNFDSISHSFQMEVADRFIDTGEQWPLIPGTGAAVFIGSERVMTGQIDRIDPAFDAGSRSFSVAGRSRSGDLVDCSHVGDMEFNNIGLDDLAETLVKPFGLKVFLSVDPGLIEKFSVKPGETVFEALDRAARTQGFLWVTTRAGNIRLTRAARARAFSELHEGVNILSASAAFDDSQRFSEYTVRGQRQGTDEFAGLNASEPEGTATDKGVKRYRPLIVIAESSVDSDQAATRAAWEASSRVAAAAQISVTVQGWRQENGALWDINQVVRLRSPTLGLNRDFLISSVEHSKSSGGTVTGMGLVRPDAFTPKPEFKEADDPLSGIGPEM